MSQNVVNYSDNPTGPELLDNYLAKSQENELTNNSGIQRPSYARAGTSWINTSTTPWTWYLYDGSNDIAIGTFNASTHKFISANLANVVNLTTDQTVNGLKTFAKKPRVPTPTSSDNTATVINIAYLNDPTKSTSIMHLTGNETASGQKTFTGEILRQMSSLDYGGIKVKNTAITKGTAPSTNVGGQFTFQDSSSGTSEAGRVGGVEVIYLPSRDVITSLRAYRSVANSTEYADIAIYCKANGTKYAIAPTPTSLDNSDKIVTCKLINQNIEQVHVIIDSYRSGSSWYRIYDDGWVEQGGNISMYSSNSNISLLKAYSNTNYTITISFGGTSIRNDVPAIHNKTTSTFQVKHTAGLDNDFSLYWQACGMGAE